MLRLTFISFVLTLTLGFAKAEECKTPNNETGQCISLYTCTVLINVLSNPSTREFLQKSNCGGTVLEPLVCCGSHSNYTIEKKKTNSTEMKRRLPGKTVCGFQHSDDYFHTVNTTVVTEFPWLAIMVYDYTNNTNNKAPLRNKYLCSGSLINTRYILTAAQCLENRKYKPVGVRLGEYHIKNDTDCIEESQLLECSDTVQDLGIEKTITHSEYITEPYPVNDIGLVRLNKSVLYSDYIRPICLPFPGLKRAEIGDILITSGWGQLKSHDTSQIKKRTYSKLLSNKECEEKYQEGNRTLTLNNQICGLVTDDSEIICNGDGGGPVMFNRRLQWVQEGIVSFGSRICKIYPEVYTKVESYMVWIEESLEP